MVHKMARFGLRFKTLFSRTNSQGASKSTLELFSGVEEDQSETQVMNTVFHLWPRDAQSSLNEESENADR